MSVTEFWLKRASELAAMDYRECKLLIGKHRVNQLTVVGVAAEVVWKEAFHERRGLSNVQDYLEEVFKQKGRLHASRGKTFMA